MIFWAIIILFLAGLLYYPTLIWLFERFVAPDSYYSHGFLVPLISGFLLWRKKDVLRNIYPSSSRSGILLIFLAFILHLFGLLSGVHFVSAYTLLLLTFGISLFLFGKNITKEAIFPLCFLVFMLPLPLNIINSISFGLRMFATKSSVFLLKNVASMPVANNGFLIILPHDTLVIGNPCSGLRSLISLIAMGSVFSYLYPVKGIKKIIFTVIAIPLALMSNIVRIMLLSVAAYFWGTVSTRGIFHDATGCLVFLMAFGGLWYSWKLMEIRPSTPNG